MELWELRISGFDTTSESVIDIVKKVVEGVGGDTNTMKVTNVHVDVELPGGSDYLNMKIAALPAGTFKGVHVNF